MAFFIASLMVFTISFAAEPHKKGQLLVECTLKLENGDVVQWLGYEVVSKSTTSFLYVEFAAFGCKVPVNDCSYKEDPTVVSRNPEEYFSKFMPPMSQKQYETWRQETHE